MKNLLKERNEYIDYLKGITIFLVVLGHCWTLSKPSFWFIYRFHMPLFFCISGYLFNNKKSYKEFLVSKIKSLILPYCIFFVLSYALTKIFLNTNIELKKTIISFFANGKYCRTVNNFAIWYLPLFFIASNLFFSISKIKNKKIYGLIIFIFGIISVPFSNWLINTPYNEYTPFSMQVLPAAIFFMGIGNIVMLIKDNYLKSFSNEKYIIAFIVSIALFFVGIILSFNNQDEIISITTYKYLIAALFIIPFIIIITLKNENKIITYLGRNSLFIFGIHRPIIGIFQHYKFDNFLKSYNITGDFSAIIISILCITIICITLELLIIINKALKNITI